MTPHDLAIETWQKIAREELKFRNNSFEKGPEYAKKFYKPGFEYIEEAIYKALKQFVTGRGKSESLQRVRRGHNFRKNI
jgi:hypothetical protein